MVLRGDTKKPYDFIKMMNMLIKIGKVLFLRKLGKTRFADKDLSPPGLALAGLDMSELRCWCNFRTFRVQNWLFEVIS